MTIFLQKKKREEKLNHLFFFNLSIEMTSSGSFCRRPRPFFRVRPIRSRYGTQLGSGHAPFFVDSQSEVVAETQFRVFSKEM